MRIKFLVLLGIGVFCSSPYSQAQTEKPVFFVKGKMSVIGNAQTKTLLYVDGDFVASRDAEDATVKSDIVVSGSQIVLKGDFIQDSPYMAGALGNHVFSFPATGYQEARLVFNGSLGQHIKTRDAVAAYSSQKKGFNYIDFPTLVVDNVGAVKMAPDIAANPKMVDLTNGKLILSSARLGDSKDAGGKTINGNFSMVSHLNVPKAGVLYNRNKDLTTAEGMKSVGVVQVQLQLDEQYTADYNPDGKSIVGMGSPFKKLGADYFMWNHLLLPHGVSLGGNARRTEMRPEVVLSAGRGFVTGIDLRGAKMDNYIVREDLVDAMTQAAFDQRFKDGYVFDRFAFDNMNNLYPLNAFASKNPLFKTINYTDQVQGVDPAFVDQDKPLAFNPYLEELVDDDLTVHLAPGTFNYLSNPFMAPLDMTGLLAGESAWGVKVGPVTDVSTQVFNKVWLLNPTAKASASHYLNTGGVIGKDDEKLYAQYGYFSLQETGGTFKEGVDDNALAPMQMFLVYTGANGGKSIPFTIPASARAIGKAPNFVRSANNVDVDDFFLEVKDHKTKMIDRAAIVIRTPEQIKANPNYQNVSKVITNVSASQEGEKSVTTVGTMGQTINTFIYTKDYLGTILESNFLPVSAPLTEAVTTLYLAPSVNKQDVSIRVGRLYSMNRTQKIMLKDKLKNKTVEISNGKEYVTQVNPNDAHDRFELRFLFNPTAGVENDTEGVDNSSNSIYSHYKDNLLTVKGLTSSDINSTISVYNLQGQMLTQVRVDRADMMEIPVHYETGAYIVKLVGKNSHVSKFLVK